MRKWLADRFDRAVRWRASEQISAQTPPLVEERVRQPAAEVAWAVNELQRLGPQLAALEARIEDRRQSGVPTDASQQSGALSYLDEIRAEHERIRARLFSVTRYVNRLEDLERRVDALERTSRRDG